MVFGVSKTFITLDRGWEGLSVRTLIWTNTKRLYLTPETRQGMRGNLSRKVSKTPSPLGPPLRKMYKYTRLSTIINVHDELKGFVYIEFDPFRRQTRKSKTRCLFNSP